MNLIPKIKFSNFLVGHTHGLNDQVFGRLCELLKGLDIFTLSDLTKFLNEHVSLHGQFASTKILSDITDWTHWIDDEVFVKNA